eukprot:Gb_03629 [translate_table: standard]
MDIIEEAYDNHAKTELALQLCWAIGDHRGPLFQKKDYTLIYTTWVGNQINKGKEFEMQPSSAGGQTASTNSEYDVEGYDDSPGSLHPGEDAQEGEIDVGPTIGGSLSSRGTQICYEGDDSNEKSAVNGSLVVQDGELAEAMRKKRSSRDNDGEGMAEDDVSDEEIDVDELEKLMWKDRIYYRRMKEQQKAREQNNDKPKHKQSQEQVRRKNMSTTQDGILEYMLKIMEVCKAQEVKSKTQEISSRKTVDRNKLDQDTCANPRRNPPRKRVNLLKEEFDYKGLFHKLENQADVLIAENERQDKLSLYAEQEMEKKLKETQWSLMEAKKDGYSRCALVATCLDFDSQTEGPLGQLFEEEKKKPCRDPGWRLRGGRIAEEKTMGWRLPESD